MTKVYLAGPVQHVEDYGRGWREWIKQERAAEAIEWVDPLDVYDTQAELEAEWSEERIVEEDLELIDGCDAMLVHWQAVPTAGTPMEMFYAQQCRGELIPVVVQTKLHESDVSPWVEAHSSTIVETFDDAIRFFKNNE